MRLMLQLWRRPQQRKSSRAHLRAEPDESDAPRERDVCMVKPPETVHFLHGPSTGMHHFLAEMLKMLWEVS